MNFIVIDLVVLEENARKRVLEQTRRLSQPWQAGDLKCGNCGEWLHAHLHTYIQKLICANSQHTHTHTHTHTPAHSASAHVLADDGKAEHFCSSCGLSGVGMVLCQECKERVHGEVANKAHAVVDVSHRPPLCPAHNLLMDQFCVDLQVRVYDLC